MKTTNELSIRAFPLLHRDRAQIGLQIPDNEKIRSHIKLLPGVTWSQTHRCYYLEHTPANINALIRHCRGTVWVDMRELKGSPSADHSGKAISSRQPVKKPSIIDTLPKEDREKINQFAAWMKQHRYSDQTIKNYTNHLSQFFHFIAGMDVLQATEHDVIRFNQEVIIKNKLSVSYQRVITGAIKLFYSQVSDRKMNIDKLDRPFRERRLPTVLSKEEVIRILQSAGNIKHKAMLSLLYSCGLRRGEVLSLKIADLDKDRNLICIRQAKGRKDRYVPYAENLKTLLRAYYIQWKPKVYLFEGQDGGKYSERSIANVLAHAVSKAGIRKEVTLHTLRHSFATHLMESGTDIRYIQEILGHSSPKTTMIYTHVSQHKIGAIKSPFDDFSL